MLDLDELERLAGEATEGPWEAVDGPPGCVNAEVGIDVRHSAPGRTVFARSGRSAIEVATYTWTRANADFIVAARTAIPELVAEVKRLRADNERMREGLTYAFDAASGFDVLVWEVEASCTADYGLRARNLRREFDNLRTNLLAGKRWDGKE